ncbi:bifunctional diguanylate cyclase/phosphodiesterase [Agrobacterium rubi]|uniref:bifunctional diguanylate cyclase/phosphodiesterase n=1 Tax=Agrobacterium rubi TaxID=28099 RepID=UPI001F3749A9|nr:bifunctional diguanylate cyclase/phosphodiesterase [Agrobacterium rubi]
MFGRAKLFFALSLIGGVAIIGGIVFTLNASLSAVTHKTNELDAEQTEKSVRAALALATESLVGMVTDNAYWTVAYEQVNNPYPDAGWFYGTWGTTAEAGINYDGLAVLNPDLSVWWGSGAGANFSDEGKQDFTNRLVHNGFVLPDEDGKVVKGVLDLGGVFAIIAAERVRPAAGDTRHEHPSNRYLLMYKLIDMDLLAGLSSIFGINGLALKRDIENGGTGTGLMSPDGTQIGMLTWQPRDPGEAAAAVVRPKIALILIFVCFMVAAFAAVVAIGLRKLAISERRATQMSLTDTLTGLSNRLALQRRIDQDFYSKKRFKLLLIDLDRFKSVNDTYGHSFGDKLLVEVAVRITKIVGATGFSARLGGDEMAVLVYEDLDTAMRVANGIVKAIAEPFSIDGIAVSIGCSVGLCCTDNAANVTELMQRTDVALYESKRRGRGQATYYESGMLEAIVERRTLETDMRSAIDNNQFYLVYQPVMDLRNNKIVGYEALIRWDHPSRGMIPPAHFIPIAEETGLIVEIGCWVLNEACREAATWANDNHVAVNVSAVQFRSPQLLFHLTAALDKSGLPAQRLEIELTETAIVEDGEQIAYTLTAIRALGVKIAMDDFGTGYSSLTHLRDLPFDRIKIDRSFVATAETDRHSFAVLSGLVHIAQKMEIALLAEGVETEGQLELLRSIGCDTIQGYLVGRPERKALRAVARSG